MWADLCHFVVIPLCLRVRRACFGFCNGCSALKQSREHCYPVFFPHTATAAHLICPACPRQLPTSFALLARGLLFFQCRRHTHTHSIRDSHARELHPVSLFAYMLACSVNTCLLGSQRVRKLCSLPNVLHAMDYSK